MSRKVNNLKKRLRILQQKKDHIDLVQFLLGKKVSVQIEVPTFNGTGTIQSKAFIYKIYTDKDGNVELYMQGVAEKLEAVQ